MSITMALPTFLFLTLALVHTPHTAMAAASTSEYQFVKGLKFPNDADEGEEAIEQSVLTPKLGQTLQGFSELVPYVLRAPDQDDAGSCLYMSLTGIAEWWLARLNPGVSRLPDGPIDLSERHLMNLSNSSKVKLHDWKTDSYEILNDAGAMAPNSAYRFTKGWYKVGVDGDYEPAKPNSKGAEYGTAYNWIDELNPKLSRVNIPRFQREIIFADPESNQWNTGTMPTDIAERIKSALLRNKAPVQVIYNHFGYWHANFIVGFDDGADNANCHFVHGFLKIMKKKGLTDARAREAYEKARAAYLRGGGCHSRGVFYVRDSIYGDPDGPMYRYDFSNPSEDTPYSKPIVMLEYDWIRYLGNHALQMTVQ